MLVLPEPTKSRCGKLRVTDRVLNLLVAEVMLNGSRVVPIVGQAVVVVERDIGTAHDTDASRATGAAYRSFSVWLDSPRRAWAQSN